MQTLSKAIEILEHTPISVVSGDDLEYDKARQLGIEVMKWRIKVEAIYPLVCVPLLPGEYKDGEGYHLT